MRKNTNEVTIRREKGDERLAPGRRSRSDINGALRLGELLVAQQGIEYDCRLE